MKIEKLSTNKVKITVSADDLIAWELTVDNIADNTPEARNILWEIIRQAEDETGFCAENARIMIEVMPIKNEGFIMFATRIEEYSDYEGIRVKRKYRVKQSPAAEINKWYIYRFESFEDFCQAIHDVIIKRENSLYELEGAYYLATIGSKDEMARLSEYGERLDDGPLTESFLMEHGTVVAKHNAVQIMRRYFA